MLENHSQIDRKLKGQRAGMLRLLQSQGVSIVKFGYKGDHVCAQLLDAAGMPCVEVQPEHAAILRHIATSQLDANPGGPALWRRSAGTLEWILGSDQTLSMRNYPGSDHDLGWMGLDLRQIADADPAPELDRPAMAG